MKTIVDFVLNHWVLIWAVFAVAFFVRVVVAIFIHSIKGGKSRFLDLFEPDLESFPYASKVVAVATSPVEYLVGASGPHDWTSLVVVIILTAILSPAIWLTLFIDKCIEIRRRFR